MRILILSSTQVYIYAYDSDHNMNKLIEESIEKSFNVNQFFKDFLDQWGSVNDEKLNFCVIHSTPEDDPNLESITEYLISNSRTSLELKVSLVHCILWSFLENPDQKIITIDSGAENSNIYYHLPGRSQHNRMVANKRFGYFGLLKTLSPFFEKDLNTFGYKYQEEELNVKDLKRALESNLAHFQQIKTGRNVDLTIDYKLDEDIIGSAIKKTNRSLDNYITKDLFDKTGNNLILLIGNYCKLADTKKYIQNQFDHDSSLDVVALYSKQEIVERIRLGLKRYFTLKSNEEKRLLLEQENILIQARNRIIEDIMKTEVDLSSRNVVIERFRPRAEKVEMPLEVLSWHIDNRIRILRWGKESITIDKSAELDSLPLATIQQDIPQEEEPVVLEETNPIEIELEVEEAPQEESIIVDDDNGHDEEDIGLPIDFFLNEDEQQLVEEPPVQSKVEESEIVKKLNPFQVSDFEWPDDQHDSLQLESIIETEKIFPNSEFIMLKGKLKGSQILRVFRIISTNELESVENIQKFRRLYERESNYYSDVSKVFRSNFGLFYYRKFYDGINLEAGIKKIGLDQIKNLENAESAHLKLIFQLWKTVKSLDFSMTDFNAKNFIISSSLEKIMRSDFNIIMVGFKSQVSTKEEMEEVMHQMLFDLLDKNFYQEFLEKFN